MDRALIAGIVALADVLAVRLVSPETTPATPDVSVHWPNGHTLNRPGPSDCVHHWFAEPYRPPCDEFGPPKLVWLEP